MYKCKKCGNEREFIEYNVFETDIILQDGEVVCSNDTFQDCVEVICRKCKATTKDDDIEREMESAAKNIMRVK